MTTRNTGNRKGKVGGHEVVFEVTVTLNNGHICGAEGLLKSPQGIQNQLAGATVDLLDEDTSNIYAVFVAPHRFSFMDGYTKVDQLF
ncbi:hypothetical protein [Vibrio parahaemolyticus]|uniref:hypothetical protein n=1 Tax=Vibrio parahaemolyticus TaxID=670 RepID=UPI00111DD621|nr:hypothetical protein [Vibrio parahaemolyticus]MBE3752720.1 hypothetical protein [Vibrio parahaemolyticus]TOK33146.1 hypothetical protein CGI21_24655 [Vibrio parahaemolyticus]HCG8570424.1 hypothetical protein [Vibrio parahaemolyticus]HCM0798765.1 hypothetical protein [Vibrio parahaemolyticus]